VNTRAILGTSGSQLASRKHSRLALAAITLLGSLIVSACTIQVGGQHSDALFMYPTPPKASVPNLPVPSGTGIGHEYELRRMDEVTGNVIQDLFESADSHGDTLDMSLATLSLPSWIQSIVWDAGWGAKVNVILDRAGSNGPANQVAYDTLKLHGVHVRWGLPQTNFGQQTITSITPQGTQSAIVSATSIYSLSGLVLFDINVQDNAAIVSTFDEDFAGTTGPPAGERGTDLVWSPGALPALVSLVESAQPGATLSVETQQVDSPAIVRALIADVRRSVHVDLCTNSATSNSSELNALVGSGVSVKVSNQDPVAESDIEANDILVNPAGGPINRQSVTGTFYLGSANLSSASISNSRNLGVITRDPNVLKEAETGLASNCNYAFPHRAR
jgi:hypothetical protein